MSGPVDDITDANVLLLQIAENLAKSAEAIRHIVDAIDGAIALIDHEVQS